ncbi:glycosyltransferase family 39 protein [Actinocorallia lasiicapitis]
MPKNRPWAAPLLTAVLALAVAWWGLTAPSLWRDEAVTADVAGRSLPDLLRTLTHIDAVHGLYYLLMKIPVTLAGDQAWALRLPSTLAAAGTAALTVLLGRRLGSERLGITAGVLVALSPMMTRYAQEARQYALVAFLAVLATSLLTRAESRRGWIGYGLSVLLLGFTHLFALFLLPAHLATVLLGRRPWRPWAVTVGAALLPVAGLALLARRQSYQIDWIESPRPKDLLHLLGSLSLVPALCVPAAILLIMALWKWSPLAETALPWLVLPPVLLLLISLVHPTYVERYVLFCVPAACLLLAAGLERLPWKAAVPLVVIAAIVTVPKHQTLRDPHRARLDDLRELSRIIAAHDRPGDAVVYTDPRFRPVAAASPALASLDDVLLAKSPVQAGDLMGRELPKREYAASLAGTRRVWLVRNWLPFLPGSDSGRAAKAKALGEPGFHKIRSWRYHGGEITLYERAAPPRVELSAPDLTPKKNA